MAAPGSIQCPKCGKRYPFKPEFAGRQVKCKACGQSFRAPLGSDAAPPTPAAPQRPAVPSPASPPPLPVPAVTVPPSDLSDLIDDVRPAAVSAEPMESFAESAPLGPAVAMEHRVPTRTSGRSIMADANPRAMRWAWFLLIFGIGGLFLPFLGLQFKILIPFGEGTRHLGLLLSIAGAVVLALGLRHAPAVGIPVAIGIVALAIFGYIQSGPNNAAPGPIPRSLPGHNEPFRGPRFSQPLLPTAAILGGAHGTGPTLP